MHLMESIKVLRALIFALLVGFGFYFTIIYAAIAETLVIGSSKNAIKIDKITVFDEPWALTFINQDELVDLMKESGFIKCDYQNLSGGIVSIHSGWKI